MTTPAPEPPEVEAEELAAARLAEDERLVREHAKALDAHNPTVPGPLTAVMAEFDRMRAELTRTVADCGICRLGGRTVHIDDDCLRHGDGDW